MFAKEHPNDLLCEEGLAEEASELFEKMDGSSCSPDDLTFNMIIQGLLQHNETSRAMKYLCIMVDKGFLVNATTATMFINFLLSDQANDNIQELLKKSTCRLLSGSMSRTFFHILTLHKSICKQLNGLAPLN